MRELAQRSVSGMALGRDAAGGDPADERVQIVELPPVRAEVTATRPIATCRWSGASSAGRIHSLRSGQALIREFRKLAAYNHHQRPLGERLLDLSSRIFAAWHRFRDAAIDRPTLLLALAPLQAELEQALEAGLDPPHASVAAALCGNLLDSWPVLSALRHR